MVWRRRSSLTSPLAHRVGERNAAASREPGANRRSPADGGNRRGGPQAGYSSAVQFQSGAPRGKPTTPVRDISCPRTASRRLLLRLHVSFEIVEDGLPAALLLLNRVCRFAIEDDADDDALPLGHELDFGLAIAE